MTDLDQCVPATAEVAVREHAGNGTAVAARRPQTLDRRQLHAAVPRGFLTTGPETPQAIEDRAARLRLLTGSAGGTALLLIAQWLQPEGMSPFNPPTEPAAWMAVMCGIAGVWLVPGLWLWAVLIRTGAGPVGMLATRIGAPLVWYGLAGPVINKLAEGARVTVGGIIGLTVAATAAVSVGVVLGLLRRPVDHRTRIVLATIAGAVCAQAAMSLSMWIWDYGINYSHIRRLGWLIVTGSALLAAAGMHSRQELPPERTAVQTRTIIGSLAVIGVAAMALLAGGTIWSPAQQMPSAISLEQIPARTGDVAVAVSAVGPNGSALVRRASFVASDDLGRPLRIQTQLVADDDSGDRATLVLVVQPVSRPTVCERAAAATRQGAPVKLDVRDQTSGVSVQAVIPSGWCTS